LRNRAHRGETKEQRLKRLQEGAPLEAIGTLLNSISNYFNNEIRLTSANFQSSLLFLGIHASALTIAEVFFGTKGPEGYRRFLQTFVDGPTTDTQFSLIAEFIHDWRNVLAHQWIGSIGHRIQYDYDMELGWEKREDAIAINPRIYCEKYLGAFSANGRIWDYRKIFSESELQQAKQRIIYKYRAK